MSHPIRNRIKAHRHIRAGDLISHEFNYRLHPDEQRDALQALYHDIGFARSLLAFELPDGRLKLIDGHLHRDIDPDMEVEVEVLDVTEDEARALLLSIDPLASLALTLEQLRDRLQQLAPPVSPDLQAAANAMLAPPSASKRPLHTTIPEQYQILMDSSGKSYSRRPRSTRHLFSSNSGPSISFRS